MGLTFRAFWYLFRVRFALFFDEMVHFSCTMARHKFTFGKTTAKTAAKTPHSSSVTTVSSSLSTAYRRKHHSILHGRPSGSENKTGERCFLVDIRNPCKTRRKTPSSFCFAVSAAERDKLRAEYLAGLAAKDSEAEVSEYGDTEDEEQSAIDELTDAQQENLRPKKSKSKTSKSKTKRKKSKTAKKRPKESDVSESESEPERSLDDHSFHHDKREQRKMVATTRGKGRGGSKTNAKKRKAEEEPEASDKNSDQQAAELAQLRKELDALKAKHSEQGTKGFRREKWTKKSKQLPIHKCVVDVIKKQVFPHKKFVTTEEGCDHVTGKIFDILLESQFSDLDVSGTSSPGETPKVMNMCRQEFIMNISCFVRDQFNTIKSNHQAPVKKWVMERYEKGKFIPTVEQLVLVASRQGLSEGDPNLGTNQVVFDVYWDEMLPRTVGNASWGPNKRRYGLLSTHHAPNSDEDHPYVTPSDEAFFLVLYENGYDKWKYYHQCAHPEPTKENPEPKAVEPDAKVADSMCKFTNARAGQAKFGGWMKPGRKQYKKYLDLVVKARASKQCKKVEQECLERLRDEHKMDQVDKKRAEKKQKSGKVVEEESDEEDGFC